MEAAVNKILNAYFKNMFNKKKLNAANTLVGLKRKRNSNKRGRN